MRENKGITLIALVITIIVLMILAGVTISMVLNGGMLEKAQTATKQYTIAQIKEEIENELVEIQAMILQQEKRMATLDDVDANFVAKGYPTRREVETAEQKETKVASLEVIQIADVNNVLKVGYKGYIATINTALKVIKVEEGELSTSKIIGKYEITKEEGENLTISITIENEDGLESITYPDAPEDAIIFVDKRAITTKDITLQAEQEYEIKIKAAGEEEQVYKIIPTTKPIIQVTKTEIREETVENETIQKKVKTIEIEYSNNSKFENYYSIDNGITWIKYTEAIEIEETTVVMAKSRIKREQEIVKKDTIQEIEVEKICTQIIASEHVNLNKYAIDSEGNLWAWGTSNKYGQLTADGTIGGNYDYIILPNKIAENVKMVQTDERGERILFLDKNNQLFGLGKNNRGELGNGTQINATTIVPIDINFEVKQIELIGNMTFILDTDGNIWCSGWGDYGALGIGDFGTNGEYKQVIAKKNGQDVKFKKIILDSLKRTQTIYAIDINGDLWGWGRNTYGQLGIGDRNDRSLPVLIKEGENFSDVSYCEDALLAIDKEGNLWGSGKDNYGRLAGGTSSESWVETLSKITLQEDVKFKKVIVSDKNSYAIDMNNNLWGWGERNKLGGSSQNNEYAPIKIVDEVKQVFDSYYRTYIIDGNNDLWELANMKKEQIQSGTKFIQVIPSINEEYAIDSEGNLWAWGSSKALGNGNSNGSAIPVIINLSEQ